MPKLVKSLKKQLSYVKIEGEPGEVRVKSRTSSFNSEEEESSIPETEEIDELLDSTCLINSDGVFVRRSRKKTKTFLYTA